MKAAKYLAILLLSMPAAVAADIFGEGYSSSEPGGPSAIFFRAFTLYTGQEVCDRSPLPAELKIFPNPLRMKVGDRIHRSNVDEHPSELVIEAFDKDGAFLSGVPIIVNTVGVQNVIETRSDWDYFEAIQEGEDELVVSWACATAGGVPVEGRVRIVVTLDPMRVRD